MDTVRTYHAHQGRVTDTVFAESSAWILTTGRDKNFYFHCTQTGKRLGGYMCNAWCTSLAYDKDAQYVFVGDYSGAISVLHVTQNGVTFINTLKVYIIDIIKANSVVSGSQWQYPVSGLGWRQELVVFW